MSEEATEQSVKEKKSVPVWLLTTVLVTLIIGVVAGSIAQNVLSKQQVSMSAPDLISFVFTVALGAASIILAIITIVLSRKAEDALIRRSDEGIRLQNDVFVRTNEVLSRIQSSTGVTEKRIEDIISGRTNIIAQEVLDKSLHGKPELRGPAFDKLRQDLADSLRSELVPLVRGEPSTALKRLKDMEERQKALSQTREEWREYRTAVVTALQCLPNMQLISEAQGSLSADEPEKFWDAVFQISGRKIGFDIHTTRQFRPKSPMYSSMLTDEGSKKFSNQFALRAIQDALETVCIVINQEVGTANPLQKLSKQLQKILPDRRVWLLGGSAEQVVEQFREKVLSES
jgi:hypothetical protein